MATSEFKAIVDALEHRYSQNITAIERLELTRLLSFYYRKIERSKQQQTVVIIQSKANTYEIFEN
ncbi:MAG TPA: hypothetical protein P5243_02995 [Bacteroidales bacterium]|nr:hypothetical protein [Bacteroidales bacterium]